MNAKVGWVGRALGAGFVAAFVGTAWGATTYFQRPGAMKLDWSLMLPMVVGYALLCCLLGGFGMGAGMKVALGDNPGRATLGRVLGGAVVGAVLGTTLPAFVGLIGFGSVRGPYMGTENIVASILLGTTAFVAVFSPALNPKSRLRLLPRFGLAALASIIAAVTLGGLGWLMATQLDLVPNLADLRVHIQELGIVTFCALAGLGISVAVGVYLGLATWLYLSAELLAGSSVASGRGSGRST